MDETKRCKDYDAKYRTEHQNATNFKRAYSEFVQAIKDHDFGKCDCRLKLVPQVAKALDELPQLSMGPRMIGKVISLKNKKK